MKKILLTIFAVLFFVLPNNIVASQEKKTECLGPLLSFMKRGWENLKNVRRKKKIYPADQSAFEKIPQQVFCIIFEFMGSISHEKHMIKCRQKGGRIFILDKFNLNCFEKMPHLKDMLCVSTAICPCVACYLGLLKGRTNNLNVVVSPQFYKQQERTNGKVEIPKQIQVYKNENYPNAKIALSQDPPMVAFFRNLSLAENTP